MKSFDEIKKDKRIQILNKGTDGFRGYYQTAHTKGTIIVSFGGGWEHVSIAPFKGKMPSWEDMCEVKDMIWNDDECVVQYHPPKAEYVNNMPNCLHLWKPIKQTMPVPPSIFVGLKGR